MKKAAILISTLALAGTGVITGATATPAAASPCDSGAVCSYANQNWAGYGYPVHRNNANLTRFYGWEASESIYNNGNSCRVFIYSGKNYTGVRYPLNKHTGWKSVRGSALWHHAYSNRWC